MRVITSIQGKDFARLAPVPGRRLLLVVFATSLLGVASASGQTVYTWSKWGLQFTSPEPLEKVQFEDESADLAGWDSFNYAIEIEAVPFEDETSEFLSSPMTGAIEMASDMFGNNYKKGGAIAHIRSAFFMRATDTDSEGKTYPVLLLVIHDNDRKTAFEITVDCYSGNSSAGTQIVKSFRFID